MAQYLISVWHDEEYEVDFTTPDAQRRYQKVSALNEEMQRTGTLVFGGGLMPASSATTVACTSGGDVSMTDGPYAESKEQMGGFWVIEAPDFDAALEWTRRCAEACEEQLELRPFQGA
jgi:hypothetical protein